ncbi:probable calcium-binding protein CML36 [Ipomoea triloba]|uniref:probable calcium-binding protein CML36 n=1 Tax=Ipomoea triloba TaxID=35885 RepID=UPI00125D49B5|nr:probable calcium-binding protein CML36 [Ipomoea triloba]
MPPFTSLPFKPLSFLLSSAQQPTILLSHLSLSSFSFAMKLIKSIPRPAKLFKSLRSRSLSRSDDPSSVRSGTTSSSSSASDSESQTGYKKPGGESTPTSVLPALNREISPDEWPGVYAELVQAFKLIDRDDDGKIRKEELEALLSRVGAEPPTREELRLMLSEVDRDGDGCISLEEFSVLSSAFAPPSCDSELRDAFDFFDTDHDGKISAEELFNVFRTIGDSWCTLEECRRMIVGVDNNGDGFVCFEDFCRMMEQQR